jgi:ketosteroid isomerase-like protein
MSQENVEIIRKFIADRNRGVIDLARFRPDVEWHALAETVTPGVYRGHEAVRAYFAEVDQEWETRHFEIEELVDAGKDKVVAVVHTKARGKRSGANVEIHLSYLSVFRDGLVASVHSYRSREEALEAVGLSKQGAHADS